MPGMGTVEVCLLLEVCVVVLVLLLMAGDVEKTLALQRKTVTRAGCVALIGTIQYKHARTFTVSTNLYLFYASVHVKGLMCNHSVIINTKEHDTGV